MRKTTGLTVSLIATVLLAGPALAQPAGKAPIPAQPQPGGKDAGKPGEKKEAPPMSPAELDSTLYAMGFTLGQRLHSFNLSKPELEKVKKAMADALAGQKPQVDLDVYGPKIQQLAQARLEARAEVEKKASQAFLEKTAKQPGVQKLPSGLLYQELKPGSGKSPTATDTVQIGYRGTLIDGTEFDSSLRRGAPGILMPLDQAIPCWTEAVQKMKIGGKARIYCPPNLAYGDRGSPPSIPGGAALIFDVELVDIPYRGGHTLPWQPGQPQK